MLKQAKPVVPLVQEAREAGLRYSSDEDAGFTRKRHGAHFDFYRANGARIRDAAVIARIRKLAIPPAYTGVWICPLENGHLQATGRDARGRKQYRYHAHWRQQRDETKFQHMLKFAQALPKIRRRVARDLRRPGMPREKIIATVVRLLETTVIRVGNDEYARDNHSYGLTTMRNRHVEAKRGGDIAFSFRGKSGKHHEIELHDQRLAKIIRRCQEMPGQVLFSYLENGQNGHIDSQDVNDYLREITGRDFTAKDFRTWIGTVLAATAFREFEAVTSEKQARKNAGLVVESVAKILGNTPAVCRKAYIHPEIINAYFEGKTIEALQQRLSENLGKSLRNLKPAEAAVLALLQRRLQAAARKSPARLDRLKRL
jgi:DNA topoisomerase-1